jgi:tetratricopeptide (TPR) repeat protein
MLKKNLTLLLSVLITGISFGQMTESEVREYARTKSEPEVVQLNSTMMQDGFLYYADILADRLLTFDSENANYNYRKGFVNLKLTSDFISSIPFLIKACKDVDPNYDAYSHKEKSAPTDAYYHLAACYHSNEEIDKAAEFYSKFLESTRKNSELIAVTKVKLIQCENAKRLMATPVNVRLKNLGSPVNTQFPEYSSVISLDGSSIYFTSRRPWSNNETENFKDLSINQYPEDVYFSLLNDDSTWTEPIKLDFCLPRRNEATMAVSLNERRIYLYEDSTGNGDIFYTDFYTGKFNDINQVEHKNINTEYWEPHAMVSPDGSRMFFSSDRPGGYGGRDIYMSVRKADSTWSKPVNLGPKVNTPNDEDGPFVSVDNKKLYFASNGNKSIGGFDILSCDLLADGTWSESQNIGYPFNSTNDDAFYTTTVDGLRGYMTSMRKDGRGEKDIYEIHNDFLGVKNAAMFKGLIKTSDGSPLPEDFALMFKLSCNDCEDNDQMRVLFPRLRDGMFMTGLEPCKTYKIAYYNATDNNVMHEETFQTACNQDYQEIYRELILDVPTRTIVLPKDPDIVLEPVDVVSYKNLEFIHYFDYNKNKLTVSKGELKDFVKEVEKQLKEGRPRITINVYSSASKVPTKTYETNEKLTQIRAENMKYDLSTYFESKPEYAGKVNVVIVFAVVDGPEYEKDFKDKKKYKPYQFVGLKTE